MVRKVRQRIVDLADQEVLTIGQAGYRFFMPRIYRSSVLLATLKTTLRKSYYTLADPKHTRDVRRAGWFDSEELNCPWILQGVGRFSTATRCYTDLYSPSVHSERNL